MASPNVMIRVFPPSQGGSITFSGRTYTCAVGSTIDLPQEDAKVLGANGWTIFCLVGTTAQRPALPARGIMYHDTNLNITIIYEGTVWRNPATGSAV